MDEIKVSRCGNCFCALQKSMKQVLLFVRYESLDNSIFIFLAFEYQRKIDC